MLKSVYEIDENGYIVEYYVANVDVNGNIIDEDKKDFISVNMTPGLFVPRWNGSSWVEGETDEQKYQRNELNLLASLNPTPEEIQDAELDIKMITLLMEMELI